MTIHGAVIAVRDKADVARDAERGYGTAERYKEVTRRGSKRRREPASHIGAVCLSDLCLVDAASEGDDGSPHLLRELYDEATGAAAGRVDEADDPRAHREERGGEVVARQALHQKTHRGSHFDGVRDQHSTVGRCGRELRV